MQCTICDKIFTQLNNLTTHIQYIRIKASKREYQLDKLEAAKAA